MSKPNKETTKVAVLPYEPKTRKPLSPEMHKMMADTMRGAADLPNGYEPVGMSLLAQDKSIHELLDMLETCRVGGSKSENDYIAKYIDPLGAEVDGYGNRVVMVPIPAGHPKILWSTHTDTVHWGGGTQRVEITSGMAWTSDGSCLGADDTVGNWLAIEMIRAQVPGVYVFHREEESGGGGSRFMAKHEGKWLEEFDCAIALDRAGYSDVITYQSGGRCCSDEFAQSLADQMGGSFKPCETGVFTDTANYVDHIGECTNLSVGYFRQHGPMEHTNLGFAFRMRNQLLDADWTKLVFKRKAGEIEESWYDNKYGYSTKLNGRPYGYTKRKVSDVDEMAEFVRANPDLVAEFLVENAIYIDEIEDYRPWEDDSDHEPGTWQ